MCLCVCVCEREREREEGGLGERERARESKREQQAHHEEVRQLIQEQVQPLKPRAQRVLPDIIY